MVRPDELDEAASAEAEGKSGIARELMKKMAVAGLGAIFMTEEGIRGLAGQLKLPKEVLGYLVSQAEKTKDEIGRVVSEEIRRFLQSEKLREEFLKLLSGMSVEVTAQVRLVPSKPSGDSTEVPQPQVKITDLRTTRKGRTPGPKRDEKEK